MVFLVGFFLEAFQNRHLFFHGTRKTLWEDSNTKTLAAGIRLDSFCQEWLNGGHLLKG